MVDPPAGHALSTFQMQTQIIVQPDTFWQVAIVRSDRSLIENVHLKKRMNCPLSTPIALFRSCPLCVRKELGVPGLVVRK
jgi:hypothetical protein